MKYDLSVAEGLSFDAPTPFFFVPTSKRDCVRGAVRTSTFSTGDEVSSSSSSSDGKQNTMLGISRHQLMAVKLRLRTPAHYFGRRSQFCLDGPKV